MISFLASSAAAPPAPTLQLCNVSTSLICLTPPAPPTPLLLFPSLLRCHKLRVAGVWMLAHVRRRFIALGGGGGGTLLQNVMEGQSGMRYGSSAHPLALLLAAAYSFFHSLLTEDAFTKELQFESITTFWDWECLCTYYAESVNLKSVAAFVHSLNHVSAFFYEESATISKFSKDWLFRVFVSSHKQQQINGLDPHLFRLLASIRKAEGDASYLSKVDSINEADHNAEMRQGDGFSDLDPETDLTLDETGNSMKIEDVATCNEVNREETNVQDVKKDDIHQASNENQGDCENGNWDALSLLVSSSAGMRNQQPDLSGIRKQFNMVSSLPEENVDKYGTRSQLNDAAGGSAWKKQVEGSGGTDTISGDNLNGFQKTTRSLKMIKPILKGENQLFFEDKDASKNFVGSSKEEGTALANLKEEADPEISLKQKLAAVRRMADAGSVFEARNLCQQLLKKFPGNPWVLLQYAHAEKRFGNLEAARALFSDAILAFRRIGEFGSTYIRALQVWGSLEMKAKDFAKARYLFVEAFYTARKMELSSSENSQGASVYGLHSWAMLEEKLGNWSKARELLDRSENIQPGNAVVQLSRALLEFRAHNYSTARYYFRLAVESAPKDVKCWQAWALFEASQAKPGKMRQLFKHALSVNPDNIHSMQAWAHQESLIGTDESRSRARNLYKRCTEVDPESLFSWQSWAILEQRSGNIDEARKLFEKALQIRPLDVPCLQAFAYMERMTCNLESAQKLLRKALVRDPENSAVLMEAALVEKSLGHEDAAQEFFKLARRTDKQKSRIKRQMFISRKNSPPSNPRKGTEPPKDALANNIQF